MKKRQISIWMLVAAVAVANGAFAEDAYIEGDGTQGIVTDYYPTPATKIVADYAYTATTPTQMAVFGCEGALVVRHYINGSGGYAFAFRDSSGDWLPVVADGQFAATTDRRTFVLDGPNTTATLYTDGTVTATRATATPTKTASIPLAILGYCTSTGGSVSNPAKLRVYSLAIYENNAIVHYYKPYRSSTGTLVGLKDLCTGKILLNFRNDTSFACGGDISDDPVWDLEGVEQPENVGPAVPASGDYVIDVPAGKWCPGVISTSLRVVKTGIGKLCLADGNTFGDSFVISNGIVEADWAASGLSNTHLVLSGAANSAPGIFSPLGSTFTAPVAASGAGTIQFKAYTGIRPANADLTVNFGGDGRTITNGANGFAPIEFDLGMSLDHSLTFENDIALNKTRLIIKNSYASGIKPIYFKGALTDSFPADGANPVLHYYDGPIVFVGKEGRTDVNGVRGWTFYRGDVTFENSTINMRKDFHVGGNFTVMAAVTLKNCDKYSYDAWDVLSGAPGTTLTIDGGRWYSFYRFNLGHNSAGKSGTLVLTNDAQFSVSALFQNSGTINQYSGVFAVTNTGESLECGIARRGDIATEQVPNAASGDCLYNLFGGTLLYRDKINLHIGGSHKGTLNQTDGEVSVNGWTSVGRFAGGNGFYNLHGGTFVCRGIAYADITVGELGTGVVSVANGASMFGASSNGVRIATGSASVGAFILSPGGTVTTRRFIGGSGAGSLVFNGGTAKPYDALYASGFIGNNLARATVTPYGGTFDTDGKGDFTFAKPLLAAANANEVSEMLAHRWTFDGESLADPLGGSDAATVGNVTWTNGAIRLNGGANGSSQVNLGTDIFPTDGRGATIEMWVTQKSYSFWSRIVQCGYSKGGADTNFFISANTGGSAASPAVWRFRVANVAEVNGKHKIEMNRMYHVAATFDPQPDGRWICRAALHDPATGALIDELVYTSAVGWKFQNMRFNDGCWLGHSSYDADNDPNAEYHDIRIHHRALTEAQLAASATNGPAYRFAFRKKGTGTLTLTGASTYKADTAVDGGALKLASGATLPATGISVASGATFDLKGATQAAERLEGAGTVTNGTLAVAGPILPGGEGTVGTLTLAGASFTSGTLVVDVGADGTSDCLAATGALDLSNLSLALADATALDETKVYTIATATSVTGRFANENLPKKWRATVHPTHVTLAYANGTVFLFR